MEKLKISLSKSKTNFTSSLNSSIQQVKPNQSKLLLLLIIVCYCDYLNIQLSIYIIESKLNTFRAEVAKTSVVR